MAYNFDCRHFTGYKPCRFKRPCEGCPEYAPVKTRVAVLSLEALGAVLRSTCLLPAIRRQYPDCHITWITLPSAKSLLANNSYIDRLVLFDATTTPLLEHLEFDVLFSVDKSLEAGALAERVRAKRKLGFGLNSAGVIVPLNPEAAYQYDVGLNDQLKFFDNEKTETQQITETMGLEWRRDPYILELTPEEQVTVAARRRDVLQGAKGIIGYNTGCSLLFPYKKFRVERAIEIIRMWRERYPNHVVALLGGREDTERQAAMKAAFAPDPLVVNTPTTEGLRSGILWMATADMVLSGCSLGLHIAIGLKKPSIAWFGVSCSQEIDLYDRGVKLVADVGCTPCWKKSCDNEPKCYDQVHVSWIQDATARLLDSAGRG